jgi:hypothetical protein
MRFKINKQRVITSYISWEAPEGKYAIELEQMHSEQSFLVSVTIRGTQGY